MPVGGRSRPGPRPRPNEPRGPVPRPRDPGLLLPPTGTAADWPSPQTRPSPRLRFAGTVRTGCSRCCSGCSQFGRSRIPSEAAARRNPTTHRPQGPDLIGRAARSLHIRSVLTRSEPCEIAAVSGKRQRVTKVLAPEGRPGAYTASRFGPLRRRAARRGARRAQNRGPRKKVSRSL